MTDRSDLADDERVMRLRTVVDEWFVLLVVVLVAASLAGGWLVYTTHISPDEQVEERVVNSWSATGEFDHDATVQNDTEVFAEGETLTDRSTYFTSVSPVLDGTFTYGFEASSGELDVAVDVELVVRSVDDEGEEYWSVSDDFGSETDTLEPGGEVAAPFSVDVAALENRTERIEEELGSSPGSTELVVRAQVNTTGTVDGEPVETEETFVLGIEPDGDTYSVEAVDAGDRTYERTEPETTAASVGPLRSIGSLALLLGGVGGLLVVGSAKRRDALAPPETQRTRLAVAREREQFDDWISRGTLDEDFRDRPRIEIETLEDLVDLAIDSDRRVIEDGDGYYVVDELLYVYEPPAGALEQSPDRHDDPDSDTDG